MFVATRTRRSATLAVALLAVGLGALTSPARASAGASVGPCEDHSGVTVVVDFGVLGGGVQTRCAPEPVSSGFDALTKAGFTYSGTTRFPGLLCRIDGKPSPQQDPCYNAPSPSSYWAYWTAPEPGGAWTYSDMGAGNRDPEPGTVEGWAFSKGCTREPGAPSPCATTTTTTSAAGGSGGAATSTTTTSGGGSAATTSTTPGASTDGTSPPGDTAAADSHDAPASVPDAAHAADGNEVAGPDSARASTSSAERGSPRGLLIGSGLAAVVVLGAAVRRRRRVDLVREE
ncbi:MAG: hypothetical protein ACT4OV_10150 [Microthrixaceae bacterium]